MNLLKHLFILSFFFSVSLTACAQQSEKAKGPENEANLYMNRANVDRLIDAFDSPERAIWQKPQEVIALFGELEGKAIMDLGAGSGYFSFRLANYGAHVIAADVNDEFQQSIRKKLEEDEFKHLQKNIELRKVPYDNPGLQPGEVDGILIVNTYHHLDDRINYMKKALPGLKKGGKIIIVDYKTGVSFGPPESHKLSLTDAANEMLNVGFSRLIIDVSMLERQYVIIGEK
jgi:2-polyprenyl-3-methyl-5-hydroxy-6-metoxy-1,4-benzoquinol methylase